MSKSSNFSGHFLIAMPNMQDPNFLRTVTYICEHNKEGAFGIIINRQLEADVSEVLTQLDLSFSENNPFLRQKVYMGGPVDVERGLILHQPSAQWESTLLQPNGMAVTSSLDIMRAISAGDAPEKFLVSLGYAGWGAGQLENEVASNAWLTGPANAEIVFDVPSEDRWRRAAEYLGVDISLLSNDVGHG